MESILDQLSASLYLTQLSVGSIILTVFSLTLAVFFLWPGRKSSTTIHLGLAYAFLSVFHFAYFLSFSFYHPLAAYHRWITVPFVLAAEIHLSGLILQYPDNKNRRFSAIAVSVLYVIMVIASLVYFFMTRGSGIIFRFDGHYYDLSSLDAGKLIGLVILGYTAFFLVSLLIRIYQLKGNELVRMILVGTPCVIGATVPAILNVLNMKGYISREYFQVILNMCHLFSWLFMALLHLNTTRERFTFMGKIVGISIVTFLAVFILNSHFTLLDMDRNFDSLKVSEARLHMARPLPDDGVLCVFSSGYPDWSSIRVTGERRPAPLMQGNSSGYFNTMVYEEIKRIPDSNFSAGLSELLAGGDEFFSGYSKFITGISSALPAGRSGIGAEVADRLDKIRNYIRFHYYYIMSLKSERFRDEVPAVLSGTNSAFYPFREAMLSYISRTGIDGYELKMQTTRFIVPMNPSGSRIYREDGSRGQYISYIIYDRAARTVNEVVYPYILYREYMHDTANRMVMIILGVMFFMIAVYPMFFMGTMYTPLNILLKGVKRVASGELDFRIGVRVEDEIGEITRNFNTMTDRLRENRDEITRSGMRFRELADMLPDIIYETDVDLRITYMNRAGSSLAGYTQDDISAGLMLGSLLSERDYRSLKTFSEKFSDIVGAVFSRTHEISKKDGGTFTGENRAVFIYNENCVSGLRGIIRDVTEKLRTDEALLQVQKMETIGTLVAGLAHDFNNILGGITGPLSIIRYTIEKQGSMDADDFNVYLDTMNDSSMRAVDLVHQLSNLSRKDSVALVPLDLVLSLRHVIKICTSAFDKSIEIVADIPDYAVMVMGDTTQVEQVLLNLCINGSHAMTIMRQEGDKHGGRLVLSVEKIFTDEHFMAIHPEARDTVYWKLSVSDTGVGMDSSTVSKIFIPFFTTKQRGTGTGLGLAMVYNILKHHRGFIDVYSEPGIGSTFSVFLPALLEHVEPASVSRRLSILKGTGLVLIADDEEAIRLTAGMMLEKCGYEIITAVDGMDAVRLYGEHAGDIKVVVLDLLMPGMSGEAAAMELRKINPSVKILLASGMLHDERSDRLLSDYMNAFIQKPYTFEALSRAVYNLINDIRQ